ncbi:MAG TPA: hypothetical protein VJ111_17145 [Chitinophagaceae bacterium]|nr:hypothetical protein [Chitinophagaceae bacterium]
MNSTVNEITKSITGKLSLNDCGVEELQQLASQYPYSAPVQFLLARKLKEISSDSLNNHIQKASLYFQNPLWFDYLLNETSMQVHPSQTKEEVFAEPVEKMEIPATHEEVVDQTNTEPGAEDVITEPAEEIISEEQEEENQPELSVELPKFKFEPIDPSKATISFEPYHTIDYFASQGIRAKEEEKPKDQLSRQLKSFTEWLKVMKRLPVTEIAAAVSATDEKKVEKMAETSINDREVVTEAMAEVWEKQGNKAKAREIYQKLSLLNPAKSSYFAAKIEQLKNL